MTTYIETDRLILRSWKPEDLSPFAALNADPLTMKYFPATLTQEQTEEFYNRIQAEFKQKGWGLYAVELKDTGEFIGYVGLHEISFDSEFTPGVEIGWRLASGHHNHGYATEAAKAVFQLARQSGIHHLYSFTATVNKPSERVMQKTGMTKIGEFKHPKLPETSPLLMHVLYSIDL